MDFENPNQPEDVVKKSWHDLSREEQYQTLHEIGIYTELDFADDPQDEYAIGKEHYEDYVVMPEDFTLAIERAILKVEQGGHRQSQKLMHFLLSYQKSKIQKIQAEAAVEAKILDKLEEVLIEQEQESPEDQV